RFVSAVVHPVLIRICGEIYLDSPHLSGTALPGKHDRGWPHPPAGRVCICPAWSPATRMVAVTNAANRRSRTGRLAVDVEAINGLPMAGPGIENLDGFSGKGRTMTLVVLTIIVIGLVVAALAIY